MNALPLSMFLQGMDFLFVSDFSSHFALILTTAPAVLYLLLPSLSWAQELNSLAKGQVQVSTSVAVVHSCSLSILNPPKTKESSQPFISPSCFTCQSKPHRFVGILPLTDLATFRSVL
ncbi:hypothetical protein BDR06DRAFT_963984 [Suillus hirtellus]|nr:hypothetical protein BDR06DRAFT_963984 [Suillus hirtellus]